MYRVTCVTNGVTLLRRSRTYITDDRKPTRFWADKRNVRQQLEQFGEKFRLMLRDDWYKMKTTQLNENGCRAIVKRHDESLCKVLTTNFPEHKFQGHKFLKSPHGYWDDKMVQIERLQLIEEKFELKTLDDWKNVSFADFSQEFGGLSLLTSYNNSLLKLLKAIYPYHLWMNHDWSAAEHRHLSYLPRSYWSKVKNRVQFVNDVAAPQLGIRRYEDWYNVLPVRLKRLGGGTILDQYNNSMFRILRAVYPEFAWNETSFKGTRRNYWKGKDNVIRFLTNVHSRLNMPQNPQSWLDVSLHQLRFLGGSGIVSYYPQVLQLVYPDEKWDWDDFKSKIKRSQQNWLLKCIKTLCVQ